MCWLQNSTWPKGGGTDFFFLKRCETLFQEKNGDNQIKNKKMAA